MTIKTITISTLLIAQFFLLSVGNAAAQTRSQRLSPSPTPAESAAIRLVPPAEAPAAGVNLTLSPTFLSLTTEPGEPISSQFKITNNNNFTEYLEVNLMKFVASEDGSSPVIQDIEPGDEFVKWLVFNERQFTIDPNQTKTVKFRISPPSDAALGYYYVIVVSRMSQTEGGETGAVIAGSPAISVLLNVRSPNAKREIQVVDVKTDKRVYEYLPTTFSVEVKNTGNIHVAPAGDIFIDSLLNKNVAVLPVNESRGNVLPNSTRAFTAIWNEGFAVRKRKLDGNNQPMKNEKGEVQYTTHYDFSKADKFRVGKYTANMLLIYDNGERDVPIEAQVSFWVIPWKILLGLLIVAILALFGLKSLLVSNVRRVKKLLNG